ncbi:MAG: solute carrier family 23 protein [Planctomycetota bacterium]
MANAIVLALQHVLTMFGSTVAVPLIFGPLLWPVPESLPEAVSAELLNLQLTNTALLISSVMLCSGVATLLQSTYGSRLPIIQGVSFSFLAAFFVIVASAQTESAPNWAAVVAGDTSEATLTPLVEQWEAAGALGMRTIAGAVIVGGLIEAVIGFSGLMGLARRVLSPVVIGPVIMLIGLALYQAGAPVAASNWAVSSSMMALIVLFALILSRKIRIFQLFPMLLAIATMVTICWFLGRNGTIPKEDPAFVDLSAFDRADWFRVKTVFFPWGLPEWSISAIVAVLAGYLASMIESFGDYHACKNMAGGGDPTQREVSRGIGMEGLGCAITGTLGGFSSTSYSENIGLVGLTKVGSRYVVQIGAVILIVLGLFGKFGALASAIPQPVVGGLYCALFGLISAVGVRQFAKADLNSDRNLFIGGFALFMGLSLPAWFNSPEAAESISSLNASILDKLVGWFGPLSESGGDWRQTAANSITESFSAIGKTGMAVAAILGILLDNIVPGSREERGLVQPPGVLVPEGGDLGVDKK